LLYPYCAFVLWYSIKHSRDITILIVLLWFSIVFTTTPACFSSFFYPSAILPTLVENS